MASVSFFGAVLFDSPAVTNVRVAADGSISLVPPYGLTLPLTETYAGGTPPTVPAGSNAILIDTIIGSVITLPANYATVFDAAQGATTIIAMPGNNPLLVVENAPSVDIGPLTFIENGGTGTVDSGPSFPSFTTPIGVFELNGGDYNAFSAGVSTIFAAGGTGRLSQDGGIIALGAGSYTVGAIRDTVSGGAGSYDITASDAQVFLGSGASTVTEEGSGTVYGGSGHSTIAEQESGTVANGSASLLVNLEGFSGGSFYHPAIEGDTVFGGTGSVTVGGTDVQTQWNAILPSVLPTLKYPPSGINVAADLLIGGSAGHNVITARSFGATIIGGGDGDVLQAWRDPQGNDTIVAGGGAETLYGNGAGMAAPRYNFKGPEDYTLFLGTPPEAGNLLVGGVGTDLIVGGTRHDTIIAGSGDTTIATGDGGSVVQLGAGGDVVNLSGPDTLYGGPGDATIGAVGNDLVLGGAGAMSFANGAAASTVVGGSGSTTLYAGAGGGVFVGGSGGGNLLVGGSGLSLMYGGAGAGNVFQFASGTGGADVIGDFDPARDRVALAGFAPGAVDKVLATATAANGSVSIVLSDATQVTFYHLAALTGADFVVV